MFPRKENQAENAQQEKDKLLAALHTRVSVRKASILPYTHISAGTGAELALAKWRSTN